MMINFKKTFVLLAATWCAFSASAKTGRTYFTDDEVTVIRQRAQDPRYKAEVNAIIKSASLIADRSDDELWNMVPPADLTRALNVRYQLDCPVHGEEIHRVAGRFPWITSPDKPYVLECPVGHETYPSNDFNAYLQAGRKEKLDVHQKYVDDGNGYIDEQGNHYFFVGYYNFWHLWRKTLIDGVSSCGNAYLLTGDPKYAHKAAVALASISRVYPQMDYHHQAYHNGQWPAKINGRVLDYIWENQTVLAWCVAYDAIYPTLEKDEALNTLASANGVKDVREEIEKNIFQEMASDLLQQKIWGNRSELRSGASLALVMDNHDKTKGITREDMLAWLLKGTGELEFTFYNGFDRDGWGAESSLGYSNIWNVAALLAAEDLSRMGVSMVKDPKWLMLAKAPLRMRLLDGLSPRLGDVNGHIKANEQSWVPEQLAFGVTHFQDPDCAAALLKGGEYKAPLLARHSLDTASMEELAKKASLPAPPWTRDFGGYGLSVLELNDGAQTHSATMYYGSPYASHGHSDRLTMSYHIGDRDIFSELGYPSSWGAFADLWVKNTTPHYDVLIDEKAQPTRFAGSLTRFADLDGLKVAEAEAKEVWACPPPPAPVPKGSIGGEVDRKSPPPRPTTPYKPAVDDYRRLLALLDTGEKSTLVIEAFFVRGGKQHDYSFHGLPYGKFSVEDSSVIKEQKTGTLAGEDVEYSVDPGKGRETSGYQFLMKPRWYQPSDALHLAWRNDDGINLDSWFPKFSFDEVVVADGKVPVYPGWPSEMPFILLRHKGEQDGLQSLFLSISDAGKKDSVIRSVKPIKSTSQKAGGAVVELRSGNFWYIYVNGSGEVAQFDDHAQSSVGLAAVRVENGMLTKARLVGAGKWAIAGQSGFEVPAAVDMVVKSVDYRNNKAIVSGEPFEVGKNGTVVLASRGNAQKASYTATAVSKKGDDVEIQFASAPLLTGRYEAAWDVSQKKIVSKERTGGVYNQFVAHSYIGMSVVNEDCTTTAAITGYDEDHNTFTIDADEKTAALFNDRDGDGRAYVYIADIAPGAHLTVTPSRIIDLSKEKQ